MDLNSKMGAQQPHLCCIFTAESPATLWAAVNGNDCHQGRTKARGCALLDPCAAMHLAGQEPWLGTGLGSLGRTSSNLVTWQSFMTTCSPPYLATASASFCCSVTRLMTRVTGRPLSAAGWKVSNLQYLRNTRETEYRS